MNLTLIIPAVIFGALALIIIVFVLKVWIVALVGNPWAWLERQRFVRKGRDLSQADVFQKQEAYEQAVESLRSAFYLEPVRYQSSLVDVVANHNLNVLARLVAISERRSVHIENLALVEGLLGSRHELSRSYFETKETVTKLRQRQKDKKKLNNASSPDWALVEFSKKISEIKSKIDANKQALDTQIKNLFLSLNKQPSGNEITYH